MSANLEADIAAEHAGSFCNVNILQGRIIEMKKMSIQASECRFSWCINSYRSAVSNGILEEELLGSWYLPLQTNPSKDELIRLRPIVLQPPGTDHGFFVHRQASETVFEWLSGTLGNLSDSMALMEWDNDWDLVPDLSSSFAKRPGHREDREGISVIDLALRFRSSDPEPIFRTIAQTITTHIRSVNDSAQRNPPEDWTATVAEGVPNITGIGPAQGTSYTLKIYIEVRWAWLASTGALVVLNIIFFALIVAQSARNDVAVWKSSPLSLIFHGVRSDRMEHLRTIEEVADMKAEAKGIKVRLGNTSSGKVLEAARGA